MKPSYDVIEVDLTVVHTDAVFAQNQPIEAITVLQVDSPASIRIGPNQPLVPLVTVMQVFQLCPVLDEGIFITNAAAAGFLRLFVSYAGVTVAGA